MNITASVSPTDGSPIQEHKELQRVLVVTSVAAERDAVLRGLKGCDRFNVVIGGVGSAAAAASTAAVLAAAKYDLVICAGIAGGFVGVAEVGSLVVASEIVAADLGAESGDNGHAQEDEGNVGNEDVSKHAGRDVDTVLAADMRKSERGSAYANPHNAGLADVDFISLDELGFGSARAAVDAQTAARLAAALEAARLAVSSGPVLTLSTVTGTARSAAVLAKRVPGAAAEAMEGYGVAIAAQQRGIPCLELRSISNAVGPRDRSAWRIPQALQALEAASTVLSEVL
ncbi:futalosine hydrolase [Paenibacillus sp. UMB4589-SE434]|uniref:futalosine hydrolase n=1 Tax=Paenibacillus sp. UMB4589-SE434 TaxID=3046314 RepID=UPI00254BD550|nr:futalosine hydrolase [Paenibacillus sp. UMB4589-SE434]MDK8183253.1 futalosine hydrolase [Paenibacillus sp. UMB4589-SE434]